MNLKAMVSVLLRFRMHVATNLEYMTSAELHKALNLAGGNATKVNQALLQLLTDGLVTRRARPPVNTWEWRAAAGTVAPGRQELDVLPIEVQAALERRDPPPAPARVELPPMPAPVAQRIGVPSIAATMWPDAPQAAEAARADLPTVEIRAAKVEPVEVQAIVTAAAMEVETAEAPEPVAAEESDQTTLSDVLERFRARRYARMEIDDEAILSLANEFLARSGAHAAWLSGGDGAEPVHVGISTTRECVRNINLWPSQEPDAKTFLVHPGPAQLHGLQEWLPEDRAKDMQTVIQTLGRGPQKRIDVPPTILWALAHLAPALPKSIGDLLWAARNILSQPLAEVDGAP